MNNSSKIKLLLETGFQVLAKNLDDNAYNIISSLKSGGDVRCSDWENTIEKCKDYIGCISTPLKFFDNLNLEITPIPHIYKEIKGLVDIIDCPEIRESLHVQKAIEMIGQKGLEIKEYGEGSQGQYYWIWLKDEENYWSFPTWCVAPHLEEKVEELTLAEVCKRLGKNIKIIKE
jgi:hypothetical protein